MRERGSGGAGKRGSREAWSWKVQFFIFDLRILIFDLLMSITGSEKRQSQEFCRLCLKIVEKIYLWIFHPEYRNDYFIEP